MPTESRDAEYPRSRPRGPSLEDLRSSLWFNPAVAAVLGFVVALVLGNIHPADDGALARWLWPGDRGSATAFLQVVAGSVITVTSLTFTLVVVALQLASQQFSPRLLREFARDLLTQLVLGILVTTFVFSVTVLRSLDEDDPLPRVALAAAFLLVLLSVAALLGFVGHIARLVRVDTMMAAVHRQTRQVIEEQYPPYDGATPPDLAEHLTSPTIVRARTSGFVQTIDVPTLVRCAEAADGIVVLDVRPGDHVTMGAPLGRLVVARDPSRVEASVQEAVEVGYERTLEHDAAFGLRQLTDIAVKALSPGVNDPTTAAHALGHAADLLVRLEERHLGPVVHSGRGGTPRVQAPDRDLRYYLDLVVGPVRRYGSSEPIVLQALLRMLRDAAVAARDDLQRAELMRQADLVVATIGDSVLDDDAALVHECYERVELAISGDLVAAYLDRAGETRSI